MTAVGVALGKSTRKKRWVPQVLNLRPSTAAVEPRILSALAALLLLAQLPHVVHLPLWATLLGGGLIGLRVLACKRPDIRSLDWVLSSIALTGFCVIVALLIRWHYGYFVGRDPAVAFLFILVAAKFAELRRGSDATLLMCLASFLLLTQYFYSQTIVAAAVTLPAVLALGHALAVVRDPVRAAPAASNLTLVGAMLLQGAPIAILLFIVFPRLSGPLWSLPEDSMATSGLSDSMSPGSIADLSRSSEVAFRVEFDNEVPPKDLRYWRGPVFERFDGRSWSAAPIREVATLAVDANATGTINYTVMLQPHRQHWMFALDRATGLPMSSSGDAKALARIMTDGQLISDAPINRITRYLQQSIPGDRVHTGAAPGPLTRNTAGRNPRAEVLGQQLAATHDSPEAIAAALLQRFSQAPFRYTLQPSLLGISPVDEFLFDTREGFCEHYASAFAMVMRAAGIPSRVVTGYLGGEMNGDYMIVRQSDAHAWTELWIDGAWQRFDPTGAIAPSRIEDGIGAALGADEPLPSLSRLTGGWMGGMQLRWDRMNHAWQRMVVDFDDDAQARLWEKLGIKKPALWQLTAVVLAVSCAWVALLIGLPGFTWWKQYTHERRLPPAERAWQRLERLLAHHALGRHIGEAPADWLQRVARQQPVLADQLHALSQGFARQRFAGVDDEAALGALESSIGALRKTLRRTPRGKTTSVPAPA